MNQKGQSLVEFALMIPFLLIFLVFTAEFSNVFMTALRVSNLSREIAQASFRDCAPLEETEAQLCLQNLAVQLRNYGNGLLSDFDNRGKIIIKIYNNTASNTDDHFAVSQSAGSGAFFSKYDSGNIPADIITDHPLLVIGEAFYRYDPLTPIEGLLVNFTLLQEIYEVTFY